MCEELSKPFSETALEFEFCCCRFFSRTSIGLDRSRDGKDSSGGNTSALPRNAPGCGNACLLSFVPVATQATLSFCQPCKIRERGGIGGPCLPPACGFGFVCLMLFLSSEDAVLFKSLNTFPPATQAARDWAGEERWPHFLSSFALILASPGKKGIGPLWKNVSPHNRLDHFAEGNQTKPGAFFSLLLLFHHAIQGGAAGVPPHRQNVGLLISFL